MKTWTGNPWRIVGFMVWTGGVGFALGYMVGAGAFTGPPPLDEYILGREAPATEGVIDLEDVDVVEWAPQETSATGDLLEFTVEPSYNEALVVMCELTNDLADYLIRLHAGECVELCQELQEGDHAHGLTD